MKIEHATTGTCSTATGHVVVIDVLRAFTTAPFAFAAGAREIFPVGTVKEALSLKRRFPDALLMGEVGGFPPEAFDYGNSPAALLDQDLNNKRLIQRTGAGTQGLVRSQQADTLLAVSFVCAAATVRYLQRHEPARVTLVCTSAHGEDQACAAYIESLLLGKARDRRPLIAQLESAGQERIDNAIAEGNVSQAQIAEFAADIGCAAEIDRFNFALVVERVEDLLIMQQVTMEVEAYL